MTRLPIAGRWELAGQLRALRLERNLTLETVASRLNCSVSKVSRLENGRRGAHPDDVRAIAAIYGLSAARTRGLLVLAQGARGEHPRIERSESEAERKYGALEAVAAGVLWAEGLRVPGLLQTPGYARAMLERTLESKHTHADSEDLEAWVAKRPERQRRLTTDDEFLLDVVLDEATVRRNVGGPCVMAEQLRHLVALSGRENVTLRLIPFDAGAHPGMEGPIILLLFEPDQHLPDCVFVEGLIGHMFFEDHETVERYRVTFQRLIDLALPPQASREALAHIGRDWQNRAAEEERMRGAPPTSAVMPEMKHDESLPLVVDRAGEPVAADPQAS
jgi:transcriptional regulator with XRE-family HTH domain